MKNYIHRSFLLICISALASLSFATDFEVGSLSTVEAASGDDSTPTAWIVTKKDGTKVSYLFSEVSSITIGTVAANPIVGSWKKHSNDPEDPREWSDETYTFNSDGTFSFNEESQWVEDGKVERETEVGVGTYSFASSLLTLHYTTWTEDGETESYVSTEKYTVNISGDKLTMKLVEIDGQQEDGDPETYSKQ